MKFHCEECGDLDYVVVDGYEYGDRALEGVGFEIRKDNSGKLSIKISDEDADYFSQFNAEHFYNMILELVSKHGMVNCPDCGEEIEIEHTVPQAEPVRISMTNIGGILGKLISESSTSKSTFNDLSGSPSDDDDDSDDESSSCDGGDSGGGGASEDL